MLTCARALSPRRVSLAGRGIIAAAVFATSTTSSSSASSSFARSVRAHYLRPDGDELPLLHRMQQEMSQRNVNFSWGEALPSDSAGVEVLVTRLPEPHELAALPALEKVVVPFAGPTEVTKDNVRNESAQRRSRQGSSSLLSSPSSSPPPHLLELHNCHFNAASTAELAVTLLLSVVKNVGYHDAALREEAASGERPWTTGWAPGAAPSMTLNGRTALVLGYGAVGSRVASTLAALGMDVHAVARSQRSGRGAAGVTVHGSNRSSSTTTSSPSSPSNADEEETSLRVDASLLATAAVVVVCLPGTAETSGLLGERELRRLPQGAFLVNVGRGTVVDEGALFRALSDGHLGGAGIDVWYNYPSVVWQARQGEESVKNNGEETKQCQHQATDVNLGPASLPFHDLPNVVMSPHRGQSSDSKASDRIVELEAMLAALAATGEMPNRYNLERGY